MEIHIASNYLDAFTVVRPIHLTAIDRKHTPRRAAFSMVELLVVIAILSLLAGMIIAAGAKMRSAADGQLTRMTLERGLTLHAQLNIDLEQPVNHLSDISEPFDWSKPKAHNATDATGSSRIDGQYAYIERFIWAAWNNPDTAQSLPSLGEALKDTDGNGFLELVDAWGRPLSYAAFVDHGDSYGQDDFLPAYPTAFFASAGEDGDFGNDETDPDSEVMEDNLYSFELD